MKNLFKYSFILLFLITFLKAEELVFSEDEKKYIKNNTVKISLLRNFYPFSIKKDNTYEGITVDLLNLIAKKSNLQIEFIPKTWPDALKEFQTKKIDIITEISYTKKRTEYINFTKPYFETALNIFANNSIINYNDDLSSLKGKRLGLPKNIFFMDKVEKLDLFEIIEYNTMGEILTALENNEIDITFAKLINSNKIIEEKNFSNIIVIGDFKLDKLKKEDLRLGVHKSNPTLFSIIDKTFNNITPEELNQIKNKWLGEYPKSINTTYEGDINLTKKELKYLEENKTIKVCSDPNFAPIVFLDEDNITAGIVVDTTRLIEKKLNYKVKIEHVKSTSTIDSYVNFKKGFCDVLSTTLPDKNLKSLSYTKPYLEYKPVLITRDTEPFIYSLDDIKFKGIAKKENHEAIKLLKKQFPGINIIKTKTDKEAFEKVSSGEIYATVSLLPVATYNISKYGLSNLKIAGHKENSIFFSMAVHQENEELLSILNKGLDAITFREKADIFNTWANIQYDKKINFSKLFDIAIILLLLIAFFIYRQYILSKNNNKLEESNTHFQTIFETSIEAILITDKYNIIVDCNKRTLNLLGYKKDELIGQNINIFISKAYNNNHQSNIEYELEVIKEDGTFTPVLMRNSDILKNKKPHKVYIALDLSKLKKTQEELEKLNRELSIKVNEEIEKNKQKDLKLIQQARHAQMGELISMIAHQWRQPLNAVATTVMNMEFQISFNKFDLNDTKQRDKFIIFINSQLHNIEDLIQTLSTTIDDFRNFYKPDKQSQFKCVNEAINKTLNIIKANILSQQIDLKLNLDSTKEIELFESEVLQVLLNIIKNAQDNFEDKDIDLAKITISTKDTREGVEIEILDNGGGIKADILNKIFDPYFSTKDIKNGTGLGLYMSKTIIEEHHKGKLCVHNVADGVSFTIKLKDKIKE